MSRCYWCGKFVRRGTSPTSWLAKGMSGGCLRWRRFTHILCPPCSDSARVYTDWWRP